MITGFDDFDVGDNNDDGDNVNDDLLIRAGTILSDYF